MTRPRLGVVRAVGDGGVLDPLLRLLAERVTVIAWQPGLEVAAVIATTWRAPLLTAVLETTDVPLWLWDHGQDPAPAALSARAAVLLVPGRPGPVEGDGRVRPVPVPGIDASRYRHLQPFVRAAWRRKRGFSDAVVVIGDGTDRPASLRRTQLAVAPAVVATGPALIEALAFAAPTVTDAASAAEVGARDGVEVVVAPGPDPERARAAEALAADAPRAAALSRAARRLVEQRLDLGPVAVDLAARLGVRREEKRWQRRALAGLPHPPYARAVQRLDIVVGTPGRSW